MYTVDLNCDMGEGFGAYIIGHDDEILNYITSANIACGFHAGDPSIMKKTVRNALRKNVAIGAHPGLPDKLGFGRREINISPEEAYDIVVYQIGALHAFVASEGAKLQHVKPHGALFNMAVKNAALSKAIAEAVYKVDPELILFGLSGSELVKAGEKIGLKTANEVFSDRTYQEDGTLTSRQETNALITDHGKAVNQVIRMVKEGKAPTLQGRDIPIKAETVCIHGDGQTALEFAKYIPEALKKEGVTVTAIGNFIHQ
ncbi:5-oxoprolinase subunit PxpA [Siminovitchia sp. FSL H7-0308]|uniref:5-oxoprolinase subunit A n=1 Tax=Siminovitchia thermophila TaxID=1245522 RepID=A0ABS2R2J2_9BACI|nr:5-oxoprolinase subunit PxpA [Siminovitchia thermophila]MBM7713128.1 UPF0271 protein [Siminovitchia thermophila]ONK24839.1 lactam utilization protein LamB [Bacillus sp. VT-16-64]